MLIAAGHAVWILLTILYTFLALGSCATAPPAPVHAVQIEVPLPAPEGARISILSARGQSAHQLLRAANLFMSEHPGTLISIHTIEDESDYRALLRSRLLTGERVDLFHIFGHTDMVELYEHLDDLSDLAWARSAIADTLEPVSVEERFYGVPFSVEGVGLIVNRRIFEAAGISLSGVGDDFEGLEEALGQLREMIMSGDPILADFPALETVTSLPGMDYDFLARQLADIALSGEFETASAAAQAGSIYFLNAADIGRYIALLARNTSHGRGWTMLPNISRSEQVEGGLAIERVALIQQSTEVYARLLAANPELEGALSLLPIPLPQGERSHVYTHAPIYWAINAAAQEDSKALARDFLTWLYQSDEGAAFLAQEIGVLSAFRDAAAPTGNPLHDQLLSLIAQGRHIPRRHREFPQGWATGSFAPALRDYFTILDLAWEEVAARVTLDWAHSRAGEYR